MYTLRITNEEVKLEREFDGYSAALGYVMDIWPGQISLSALFRDVHFCGGWSFLTEDGSLVVLARLH